MLLLNTQISRLSALLEIGRALAENHCSAHGLKRHCDFTAVMRGPIPRLMSPDPSESSEFLPQGHLDNHEALLLPL